ncbi:carbamoyltransferase HypF [Rhodopila sp.]|uniref:carbamoyltransferase HypF n=1 Tax=Rhodopila sp. TaxID=2480087 RepID=UPI003D0FCA55
MTVVVESEIAETIQVRGLVQGVGFRPTVWRLARAQGLRGSVANDGDGVTIHVGGPPRRIADFIDQLLAHPPPLARIDRLDRTRNASVPLPEAFFIASSRVTAVHTAVAPDASICLDCRQEILDPHARRHRYPFTNCTHCGPRLSIIEAMPYDRAATTMRSFPLCEACREEYRDPADRRFHAQPIACPSCGPRVWVEPEVVHQDAIASTRAALLNGAIVAVKGLGGFQLACDATDQMAVTRLRQRKRRAAKPFALMAADLATVRQICTVTELDARLLESSAAPIVIMSAVPGNHIAAEVAPNMATFGVMLANTPLHHLLLQDLDRPIVLTSGNLSDEPQCISNAEARQRLGEIADSILMHNRNIARRVDDSVVRVIGDQPRSLRRARGFAPAPIGLPDSFATALPVLAMGAELKNTFCLLRDGNAVLSHHIGDLENAETFADYTQSIEQYCGLFQHVPQAVAVDLHPDYLPSKLGRDRAITAGLRLIEVQHHHAHIAGCMAENGLDLNVAAVLGVALDGLGYGADGTFWGGEFLLSDYVRFKRLGCFKPVAMPGGARAIREPWRSTYAHLRAASVSATSDLGDFLAAKPLLTLDSMIDRGVNAPLANSCGRLFDAVAAAIGICRDDAQYEGQPAIELETVADPDERGAYPFLTEQAGALSVIDPAPMWRALLADPAPVATKAARFHNGLATAIGQTVGRLRRLTGFDTVALSGGVFHNKRLLEQVIDQLAPLRLRVLTHRAVPAGDGGLALGQAAIAAATLIGER